MNGNHSVACWVNRIFVSLVFIDDESWLYDKKAYPPMPSTNHKNVLWLICRGFQQHKKKFIICGLFFGAFILFHFLKARDPLLLKANTLSLQERFTVKENENLEDELVSREINEPTKNSPTNIEVSSEYCRESARYLFSVVSISTRMTWNGELAFVSRWTNGIFSLKWNVEKSQQICNCIDDGRRASNDVVYFGSSI